jgi:hypothetical protein
MEIILKATEQDIKNIEGDYEINNKVVNMGWEIPVDMLNIDIDDRVVPMKKNTTRKIRDYFCVLAEDDMNAIVILKIKDSRDELHKTNLRGLSSKHVKNIMDIFGSYPVEITNSMLQKYKSITRSDLENMTYRELQEWVKARPELDEKIALNQSKSTIINEIMRFEND